MLGTKTRRLLPAAAGRRQVCSLSSNPEAALHLLDRGEQSGELALRRLLVGSPAPHRQAGATRQCPGSLLKIVHLSSLVERRSRVSSFEKAEVKLEHDQLELRSRIAWVSERLAAGAALTAQIRPEQALHCRRSRRSLSWRAGAHRASPNSFEIPQEEER